MIQVELIYEKLTLSVKSSYRNSYKKIAIAIFLSRMFPHIYMLSIFIVPETVHNVGTILMEILAVRIPPLIEIRV